MRLQIVAKPADFRRVCAL